MDTYIIISYYTKWISLIVELNSMYGDCSNMFLHFSNVVIYLRTIWIITFTSIGRDFTCQYSSFHIVEDSTNVQVYDNIDTVLMSSTILVLRK